MQARVMTKSDARAAGVRFAYHEYHRDQIGRPEVLLSINHKKYNLPSKKNSQVIKEKENVYYKTDKRGVKCLMAL